MPRRLGPRLLGVTLLLCLTLPMYYVARAYVATPDLYPGDRIESRTCRDCGGDGKPSPDYQDMGIAFDRCPVCRGDGLVDVLVPGSERPSRVHGSVMDAELYAEHFFPDPAGAFPSNANILRPLHGGIGGTRVVLRNSLGVSTEITANRHGRFFATLPPGSYEISAVAPGFQAWKGEYRVPPLTEPIWLEEANVIREPESAAHAQSMYGLTLEIYLERP